MASSVAVPSTLRSAWRVGLPRLAALALVSVGACLLAAVPAHAARAWGQPSELQAAGGEPIQTPTIAFTSQGELLATWAPDYRLPDGSSPGMRFAARAPGGAFGPASTLDTQNHLATFETDRSGGAFLAWVRDGQQLVVAYRPAGGPVQAPAQLGPGNVGIAMATNAAGDAVVAYNRYGYADFGAPGDTRRIYTSFRPRGGSFGPPQPVSLPIPDAVNNYGLDVALLPDGRALYVWEQLEGQVSVVRSAVRGPLGEIGLPAAISRPGRNSSMPRVGADGAGRAVAVWVEAADRLSSGPVIASHRPTAGPFGPARELGGFTASWLGPDLGVSDGGEAIVAFQHSQPVAGGGAQLGPAQAAIASTATGSLGAPRPLTKRFSYDVELATNARGDALVWFREFGGGDIEVARRTPFSPFGEAQAVRCAPPPATPDRAALAPNGAGVLLSHVDGRPTEISEDHDSAAPPLSCHPAWQPPPRRHRSPRLRFSARISGAPRLGRDRRIRLRVDCNQPCLVKARGSMKVPRRRKSLPLTSARVILARAGSRRLSLSLSRRRARALSRSPRRLGARATIRLRAQGVYGGARVVTFRGIRP